MEDNKELRSIALHGALELARGRTQTAEDVVKSAETIHKFLVDGENETKQDDN